MTYLALLLSVLFASLPVHPPAELFAAGMAAAEAGETDRALDLLEAAAALEPDNLRYGAEYRQAAIAAEEFDRSIHFFKRLAKRYPESADVRLNWGYAYVDKIPAAGAVTQVILANTALSKFTESLERDETWLGLYTRGNSYIYWPTIFDRAKLGIDDLERAVEMSAQEEPRGYHAHAYAALGDGWWRLGDIEKARAAWQAGVDRIGDVPYLEERLALEGEELDAYLSELYAIGKRVGTDLRELWAEGAQP